MSSFLNQTTFCPTCGGSGYTDIEDNKSRAKCNDCQGNGVFVQQSDALLYFGSSGYFDFARREKIKTLRVIYFVVFGVIILALIIFAVYIFKTGSEFLRNFKISS